METKKNPGKGEAMPVVKDVKTEVAQTQTAQVEPQEAKVFKLPNQEHIKKTLDEQIKKYDRLNRLVTNRLLFVHKKEQLTNYLNQIELEAQGAELETKVCKMVLSDANTYRNEGLTISNTLIIEKLLRSLVKEIDEKIKSLETEILATE